MATPSKLPALPEQVAKTVDGLLAEAAQIKDQQQPGLARLAEIKKALVALMGFRSYGGASVQHNRSFNPEKFSANYPPETHPQFYKQVPNLEAIKAELGTNEADAYYTEYDPKVVIK